MSSRGSCFAWLALTAALAAGCGSVAGCGVQQPQQTASPAAVVPAPAAPAAPQVTVPASGTVDASRNDVDTPPAIRDEELPPLPVTPFPAARPMEVVRAVYTFAARHPEVLSKMPCFCGCESRGHRH
ncbi:MAG TPA: PCYCGC motif-containing (lipo)protein, partial [Vicinamibacterales bacterium]|nr:PCYCGC motif-containing (lipo)protein [Vicinamibacterales bacterium]